MGMRRLFLFGFRRRSSVVSFLMQSTTYPYFRTCYLTESGGLGKREVEAESRRRTGRPKVWTNTATERRKKSHSFAFSALRRDGFENVTEKCIGSDDWSTCIMTTGS